MTIFIIAYACEPGKTSEPGVGWNVVKGMAERHRLKVLTRANNRDAIMAAPSVPGVEWLFFDLSPTLCRMKKRIPFGAQIYQELWNQAAAKKYADEMRDCDVVHQLTFGAAFFTPWAAANAHRFVWGPLGGGDKPVPFVFTRKMGVVSFAKELFYRLVSRTACRGTWWSRRLRAKTDAIIFRTREFASRMPVREGTQVSVVGETAYTEQVSERKYDMASGPLRVVMVTRLMPHKAPDFAIEAFARFTRDGGDGVLTVCGSGSLSGRIRKIAVKAGVGDKVNFLGQVKHDRVLEELKRSDVMLHLSFREGGSWSILEAMAHGLPVICQKASGMDDMVADDCGSKITASTPDELVATAAKHLMAYYADRNLIMRQGLAAQRRVAEVYRWQNIVCAIDAAYEKL